MSIYSITNNALATLSPAIPFSMAPYQSAAELPATFITYQLISGNRAQSANNAETLREYLIQITIYSTAGLHSLPNVDAAMLAAGFQKSAERQLPRDDSTGHFILAKDYVYVEDQ